VLYVDDSGDSKNYDSFCDVVPEGLKLEILIYLMFAVIIVVVVFVVIVLAKLYSMMVNRIKILIRMYLS